MDAIVDKLPFSSLKMNEIKLLFKAPTKSSLEQILMECLKDYEESTASEEVKLCVGSIENKLEFATATLGNNIAVETTKNSEGWSKDVLIGQVNVKEEVITSVICHKKLYPYLVYMSHSVPNSRVYRVGIGHPKTKKNINQGITACQLDTSNWDPNHLSFKVLGGGPGQLEVYHWLFENVFSWRIA
jgi:hypothetical protein